MANSILDPNDYVPDPMEASGIHTPIQPNTPWGGQGPLMAAAGNIGGLAAGLPRSIPTTSGGLGMGGATIPSGAQSAPVGPPSGPQGGLNMATNPLLQRAMPTKAFTQDDAQQVAQDMMGRIRTPEDIAAAKEERRGALQQLVDANSHPSNTLDWLSNMMIGASQTPSWANGGMRMDQGIGFANKQWLDKNVETNQKGVQNAQAKLEQLGSEEKYANDREKAALSDESKIIAAQSKGGGASSLASQLGYKFTADGVMQIGADGQMHMIMPANHNYTQIVSRAMTNAKSMADGFTFSTPEEKQAYVNKNYEDLMAKELGTMGSIINNQTSQGAIPQATPGGQPMNPASLGGGLTTPRVGPVPGKAPGEFAALNEAAAKAAPQRENDRLTLLQEELAKEPDPTNQERLKREIAGVQAGIGQATTVPASATKVNSSPISTVQPTYPISGTLSNAPDWVAKYSQPTAEQQNGPMNKVQTNVANKSNDSKIKNLQSTIDTWQNVADAAKEEDMHIDTIRALMNNGYTPGMGANVESKVGRVLQMAGVPQTNDWVQKSISANQIAPAISRMVNDRLIHEKGQQTDSDVARIDATYPHITDTPQGFQFKLDHLQELAQRNMMRVQFAQAFRDQNPTGDVRTSWNQFADSVLGPSVMSLGKDKQPMTRQQFIKQVTSANEANGWDQTTASQYAAKEWMTEAKKTGWLRDANK